MGFSWTAIKNFFSKAEKAIQKDVDIILKYAVAAEPYIAQAAMLVTTFTPNSTLGTAEKVASAAFPSLFNGTLLTVDEFKNALTGVATSLVEQAFPELNTTNAKAAIQLAYVTLKNSGKLPDIPALDAAVNPTAVASAFATGKITAAAKLAPTKSPLAI